MNALAFVAQAVLLGLSGQVLVGALLIAFVMEVLWRLRGLLNPHFDMVLIMTGWGGLGMLAASWVTNAPVCHASPAAMWVGMLAFSAWPAYRSARCLRAAQAEGRLAVTLVFDLVGMAAGMAIPLPVMTPWLHHAAMLVGMTLGMGVAMLALQIVLRPQVPANS